MMKTMSLLTEAVEAHRKLQVNIYAGVVDAGTSWTTGLSKFFTSLGDMMRGHIADSMSLLNILNDIYSKHVDYLVTGLSTQLQDCASLAAEVRAIIIKAQSTVISQKETERLYLLHDCFEYLNTTIDNFELVLNTEARKSSHHWHYFSNPLRIDECVIVFHSVHDSLVWQLHWLDSFIFTLGTIMSPVDATIFANMTILRSNMVSLSECLVSFKKELYSFEIELFPTLTSTLKASFSYEPPTSLLLKFSMDGQWLESIARWYIANSVSKLELAEVLQVNGSELLNNADQLYSDIELSLFSKVTNHIDEQEAGMVSFYSDLFQRVTNLQRYMFANDTKLEEFMRSLSIWKMPILNLQKSQVLLLVVAA